MTVDTLTGPVRDRLAKLLPLLASDQDGEVIGAARAIGRTLTSAGRDWHDLTHALTLPATGPVASSRPPRWHQLEHDERLDWLHAILAHGRLTAWERTFVADILAKVWTRLGRMFSVKQVEHLDRLIAAAWAAEVRPG